MKTLNYIKALADLALSADGVEVLVVYDSVVHLAGLRGNGIGDDECRLLSDLQAVAYSAAKHVRKADALQLEFKDMVGGQP